MSKLGKFALGVIVVPLLTVVGCFAFFVPWYTGAFELPINSENFRVQLDGYFLEKYNKRDPLTRFLHTTVFGNADKYVWEPPQPVLVYDDS